MAEIILLLETFQIQLFSPFYPEVEKYKFHDKKYSVKD